MRVKTPITVLAAVLLASNLPASERNVVLFVVDDQGLDAGCYGNPVIQTPNLDRLASDGTLFLNAYCTTASCSASRSVILSGLHNHATGQYGHQHSYNNFHSNTGVLSLPYLLGQSGYRTGRIGKYHVQPESVYPFEHVISGNQGGSRNPVTMAEQCRSFIQAEDSRPFFLYFCTSDPHRGGGKALNLPYQPDWFGNNRTYEGVSERHYSANDVVSPDFLPDIPESRAELAQYYQSVSRIDQGLGRLIQILKESGHYEETLILYLSDNGIAFPGAKTTLYDPGMHLPLVVRNPYQLKRGIRTDAMVSWVDLTPTILEFTQVETPTLLPATYRFHGRSFLSVMEQEHSTGWDEVFASHTFHEITMYYPMRVIQNRRFKLIWNLAHPLPYPFASDLFASATWQGAIQRGLEIYGKRPVQEFLNRPQYELYDLVSDREESNNLAYQPTHERVLTELKEKLRGFQSKTDDPWIIKYTHE